MMRQSKLKWREEGKKFPSLLLGGRLGGGKGWMDRKTKLGEGEPSENCGTASAFPGCLPTKGSR